MEKFGIFELLDALSALTAREDAPAAPPKPEDAAFRPPAYSAESGAASAPAAREEPPEAQRQSALGDFLARHDAIARKAHKK